MIRCIITDIKLRDGIELSCLFKMLAHCKVYLALHRQLLMLEATIDDIVLGCGIELSLP
jgi:hypothetical protein